MTTVDLSWKLRAQKAEARNEALLQALKKSHAELMLAAISSQPSDAYRHTENAKAVIEKILSSSSADEYSRGLEEAAKFVDKTALLLQKRSELFSEPTKNFITVTCKVLETVAVAIREIKDAHETS